MMVEEIFFYLLRNEVKGDKLPKEFELTENNLIKLFNLSMRHDLAHLMGDALFRQKFLSEGKIADKFRQQMLMAVFRYERQNFALETIRKIFNDLKIAFVPLKGAVIKNMYPQPWMRTSCDIDILIHEFDLDNATKGLIENGFSTDLKKDVRHMSFYFDNLHLELHFNICEGNSRIDRVLEKIWENTEKLSKFEHVEKPEFFVLYHIVHMSRHFMSGGCGIRPFIDLWILKQNKFYSEENLLSLLEKCQLTKFYKSVCRLTDVWMNGEKYDELSLRMEKYIMEGGVYGSAVNANTVGAVKNKGKVKYLLRIAFLPYSSMCIIYPSLKKHKILLPCCYIHRAIIKLFGRDRKKTKNRIGSTMSQNNGNIEAIRILLDELGLYDC